MNIDPFSGLNPSQPDIFTRPRSGGMSRPKKPASDTAEAEETPAESAAEEGGEEAAEDKPSEKAVLSGAKWDSEEVGFNEETPISVEAKVPESLAHKTKVAFELFAKTPDGPERVSKGEGTIKDGKAVCKIPVYIPEYKDEDGNLLPEVEYYFSAKHSDSDLLKDESVVKKVDHLADRLIESYVLEDVTFATGKSFINPKHTATLKGMVKKMAEWKKAYPDGKMALFGHTDAVGQEDANKKLSERRGDSVLAVLTKDPDLWKKLYDEEKWGLATTQELLNHLGHDAGTVDGQDGPKTQGAVKSFQKSKGKAESGQADAATREALYDAYFADCNSELFVSKDFDAIDGKPRTGCSEFNLVENTQGANTPNRRVTLLLLKSNKNFPIQYPCKHGDIGPCKKQMERKGTRRTPGYSCHFYDQLVDKETKGGKVDPPAPVGKVKAFIHSKDAEVKRFVNLTGSADVGPEMTLEVEVEAGVTKVFWKATAGTKNSKRNDPVPGFVDPGTKKPVALKDGVGEFESAVAEGKAKAVFSLGLAGGDEFTFEVAAEKGKKDLEQKVINWRRLWYQLTHHKDLAPPSMATAVAKLKDYFIEWVAETAVKHEKAPNGKVIVGSHNAALDYHGLLATTHPNQCAHIILCDKQYDGKKSDGSNHTSNNSKNFTKTTDTLKLSANKLDIFNPPLQTGAKLILDSSWSNAATGKSGTLTDDPTKVTATVGLAKFVDKDNFEITLPTDATPSATKPVAVALKVTASNGPWGGDGGTAPHNLVVIDSNDTIHTQVCLHELGHIMNMVPKTGSYKAPPGLAVSEHTKSYTGMGGSGSHCSFEIDTAKSTASLNVDGKCIMFHQLNRNCKLIYCPDCAPFVKAQGLLKFQELRG